MKKIFLLIFSVLAVSSCRRQADYGLAVADFLSRLDSTDVYMARKEAGLERLKAAASSIQENTFERYEAYMGIASSYFKYTVDSTIRYCELAQEVAETLSDTHSRIDALLLKAYALSSTGYYMEADDIMNLIPRNQLDSIQLSDYFSSYVDIYHGLYNTDRSKPYFFKRYKGLHQVYRDSMLMVTDASSDRYMREMHKKCARNGDYDGARVWNDKRMEMARQDSLTRALVLYDMYTLSHFYQNLPLEHDIEFVLESASLDLQLANQDVASCLYIEDYLSAKGLVKEAKRVADYKSSTFFKMGGG